MTQPAFHIPSCPSCQSGQMYHLCASPFPGSKEFRKNGWYCEACSSGPYQLGNVTEEDAAATAAYLVAHSGLQQNGS